MKRNIKLTISYDGTNYSGFQIQDNASTIQEKLEKALSRIEKHPVKVIGAGRTDAGVHALGQVVNFYSISSIPTDRFLPALNSNLPFDIRIIQAEEVEENFHARFSAKGKIYCYTLDFGAVSNVFLRLYSAHIPYTINLTKIKQGVALLVGKHHYGAFCAAGATTKTFVRMIHEIKIEQNEQIVKIYFKGNGFLYNMVRIIVGTLLEVGKGRIEPETIKDILDSRDRNQAGPTAPARGLCLVKVIY